MIRTLAARLAYELAVNAQNRADTSVRLADFIYRRGRSRWWSDVEQALTGGYGTLSEIRAKRRKAVKDRAERSRQPFAGFPMMMVAL